MTKRIHCIGIGGTGISAIALFLLQKGWQVSGSDAKASPYFNAVTKAGAKTVIGHDLNFLSGADLVLRSSAIPESDPELLAAKAAGLPVLKRAEFLPELTKGYEVMAVAGTHGKTTTTAMLIEALRAAGEDPSFILGAQIKGLGTNAHAGQSNYFVIEADEYDHMFLGLTPRYSLITNIEHDHPDCFPTEADYLQAFKAFAKRTQAGGTLLLCGEDKLSQALRAHLGKQPFNITTYGFGLKDDFRILDYVHAEQGYCFSLHEAESRTTSLQTCIAGRHNLLNAAAALALAASAGVDPAKAGKGLASFSGSDRRFETVYQKHGVTLINDYGHHPTQLKATLQAAREAFPAAKLWAVWEPHTYSRTQRLEKAFFESLQSADRVIITRIYAAREADTGYTPQAMADVLFDKEALYLPEFEMVSETIAKEQNANDCILVFSAGKGPELSQMIAEKLDAVAEKRS